MNSTAKRPNERVDVSARMSKGEQHITESEAETVRLATQFAEGLNPGEWVGLIGPLGAGKSVFARAIGKSWDVIEAMPSPSYTLMNSYQGRCTICHIDLYRLGSPEELDFAGLGPYFEGSAICLVEWAEKATNRWPERGWIVTFEVTAPQERRISISRLRSKH